MASTELRAAAQQALEALEGYRRELGDQQPCDAEQALKAALAEPAQEPVKQCMAHGECFGGECIYQRPAEPVQEPDSPERRCGGPGCDGTCCQPVQEPVAWADKISFESAMKIGKGHDVWPKAGDYETRTGRALIGLYAAPPQPTPLTVERLRDALVASRIVPPAAVEDPDEYDDGVTLHRIEALHRRLA